jgi:siderophore synthetase component
LIVRLLTTLLREDVAGLRTRGRQFTGRDGESWLALHRLRIPVRRADPARGDLVSDLAVRAAFVHRIAPGRKVRAGRLHTVVNVLVEELRRGLDPGPAAELSTGFRALRQEAVAALAAARLRRRRRPLVFGRLRPELSAEAGLGWAGAIGFETLAAHRDHPLYPFSLARVGLPVAQLRRVAPEHRPDLDLRWLVLPSSVIEQQGRLPGWWPDTPGVALPVHPAVCPAALRQALTDLRVDRCWLDRAARPEESFRPTLSLRTVAAVRHPAIHLKLPLPVRTLGRLNLRTITRRGLADGALVGSVLRLVLRREPQFADVVRVADESSWLHTGHPLLAVLIRRWDISPEGIQQGLTDAAIVPVAGLAGVGPDGRPVIVALADRFADGDLDRLLQQYLRLVIGWQVGLWLRYGIVLEAHPQNVLIAVDRTTSGPRIRLLLRDLDSAKLDLDVLAARLGREAPTLAELSDERLAAHDRRELADLFVTTTLHQCVAAVLIDLGIALGRPTRPLLDLIRPLLAEAVARDPDTRDASLLETGIMKASRLPVKRALTAATLLPKTRTGAADVNKYYGADAPSYL